MDHPQHASDWIGWLLWLIGTLCLAAQHYAAGILGAAVMVINIRYQIRRDRREEREHVARLNALARNGG